MAATTRMLSAPRLLVVAALTAALLERWVAVHPVLWAFAATLVPSLLVAARRLGRVVLGTPLALFCLFVPASLTWNDDPGYSYRSVLTFLAFLVISLWLVVSETPTSALGLLAAAAAVTAIAGVAVAVAAPDLIPQINPGSFQGIYTHKNWLALAMGYLFLAMIHLRMRSRLVRGVALAMAAVLLVLAQSTGAYLALMTTIGVLGARVWARHWLPPNYQRVMELIAIATGITMVFFSLGWEYSVAVNLGEGHDVDRRFQLWRVTLEYAVERPILGWGWRGSWNNSRGVTGDVARDMGGFQAYGAHNGYMDIFLQAGLVGSVLLAILLLQVIWPRLNDTSLRGWSALALFSAVFTISDSFVAGHIPILVIVTGWLFGRNPHLWRQAHDRDADRTEQHQAGHEVWHHACGVDSPTDTQTDGTAGRRGHRLGKSECRVQHRDHKQHRSVRNDVMSGDTAFDGSPQGGPGTH